MIRMAAPGRFERQGIGCENALEEKLVLLYDLRMPDLLVKLYELDLAPVGYKGWV